LIAIVVVGLIVDAVVHLHLASAFPNNTTSVLSEGAIFRAEAAVSVLAAIGVLLRPRRYTAAFALLVAASAVVAAVFYRYFDIGAIGPIPNMYDPYWAPATKVLSVIAEVAAAIAAAWLLLVLHDQPRAAVNEAPSRTAPVGSRI
jgi:hypothetical protein